MKLRELLPLILILLFPAFISAQTSTLKGTLIDIETDAPFSGALIKIPNTVLTGATDENGNFKIENVPYGTYTLQITAGAYDFATDTSHTVIINSPETAAGIIKLPGSAIAQLSAKENIPTVTLAESDLNEEATGSYSAVLSASRDPFSSAAAYTFSAARFRPRGYFSENQNYMNGIPVEDLVSDRNMYNTWGGLNDVVRTRETSYGLSASTYTFGSLDGATNIDSRASRQRKQFALSYSLSNRTYDNRIMATYGSGVMKGGWSIAGSLSKRWAEEGYVEGTFYDSQSWFLAVEKRLNTNHSLSVTHMGNFTRNGMATAATREVYDLAGTNYYNPNWGYQDGKKRNSRVGTLNQPLTILSHEWKINNKSELETSIGYQSGRTGVTGIERFNAPDPKPDFYRNLPSFVGENDAYYQQAVLAWMNNESVRQINWTNIYNTNRRNELDSIENANGITGNTVIGRRSLYVLEDRITENKRVNFASTYNQTLNDNMVFTAGITYQHQKSDNYKVVDDLLGGDFYVDIDQYAEQDFLDTLSSVQNDLNNPNRIVYAGDKFGYNYRATVSKGSIWAQNQFKYDVVDFFVAVRLSQSEMFRTGYTRKGSFPENSYGESEKFSFFNYSIKGGATYKLDGRNYFFVNALTETRAPLFNDVFVSPRTRNSTIEDPENESVFSAEGGYLLRAPKMKVRLNGYFTKFTNGSKTLSYYHEDQHTFVNYSMTGIDKQHVGLEFGIEANLGQGFTGHAAVAAGQYFYTSRQHAVITADNTGTVRSAETIYSENFFIEAGPQNAYTAGINYRSPDFWFINLNANYFDNIYLSAAPGRRTVNAVVDLDEDPALRDQILTQEKVKGQFTLDLFGGKSWRLNNYFKSMKRTSYLVLNVGISNILNNQELITGGYEQLRFDYNEHDINKWAPKVYYGYGTTYYINLILRVN